MMYYTYNTGGNRVILCAMVRGRAPQVVWGIDTDCSSIRIVTVIQVKSPFQTFEHVVEATQDLAPLTLGLKGKQPPQERDGRYFTPLQINSLFPTSCIQADGIGSISFVARK